MKKPIKILALLFILIAGLNSVQATTYYVATNGNNGNTNAQAQNTATPWKTINYAVGKLVAGDILYVRGGTYVETINVNVSGTASALITISAYSGESPVIDGQNTQPTASWGSLIALNGNYIKVSGLEVKNTSSQNARGISLYGHHNIVSKCNVHHTHQNGILIKGDYGIVEDSQVWQSCRSNVNGPGTSTWASGLSAARDNVNAITDNAIIRRNIVYNNWGEGLSSYEAQGTIIEDNIVYDNWAQNMYVSDVTNVLVQRNIIYNTSSFTPRSNYPYGITLADEVSNGGSIPHSANNTVINNFLYNANFNALSWTQVAGVGLKNVIIANNTIVNGKLLTCGSNNSNSQIRNNIIMGSGHSIPTKTGITFSNNCWSAAPPANGVGAGDVTGDPILAKTGATGPGQLTADYFKLSSASSIAVNKAVVLSQVTNDFFKTARGTSPDIGGHEYTTGVVAPNPSFCSSFQAPVIDGVEESTWTQIKTDTLKNIIFGTITSSADLFTTYKAMWDNTALYLLVKVKDDVLKNDSGTNPWDDDALELFIDGNNDKATAYDANDHQYILRINDPTIYEYHNGVSTQNPTGVTFSQGANAGGYLMEIKITWAAIGVTPASGKLVGLDIFTDDDDDGGAVDGIMSWFTQGTASSYNPSTFGTISLSGTMCNGTTTGIINKKTEAVILIYPNPVNTSFTLKIPGETIIKNAWMKIYDVCGKEVRSISIDAYETSIDRDELPNGIYFYRLINDNEGISDGKLLIQ